MERLLHPGTRHRALPFVGKSSAFAVIRESRVQLFWNDSFLGVTGVE